MAENGTAKKRVGVLTSGGDSQGMNAAVRAVVRYGIAKGCQVFFIFEGYQGLVDGGNQIREAHWEDVRGMLPRGGTAIGSARCAAFRERSGRLAAAKNLIINGIDALIVIGGDGSLTGADLFRTEWPSLLKDLVEKRELSEEQVASHMHLNIVGMVGSIDNDMSSTDATIGCYSALDRICSNINLIETTADSHQRAFVIEVMGRHCGWLANMAGNSCGADYFFIPENPPGPEEWKGVLGDIVKKNRSKGKRTTTVIISEGAILNNGTKLTSQQVKDFLAEELKLDTRITTLGHIQRGGDPVYYDRALGTLQGCEAIKSVLNCTPETPSPFIAIVENQIMPRSLVEAVRLTHEVPDAIKERDFEKVRSLRDAEFVEYMNTFNIVNSVDQPQLLLPPEKRMRIGIIHVGAPAGGMNSAARAAIAYCIARGHTPIGLYNGFSGLIRHHSDKPVGSVRTFNWVEVDRWCLQGGCRIGTNRTLPRENLPEVAFAFGHYNIQALFIVGGFEAFTALSDLRKARDIYEEFKIPMIVLPATVSNNVPGSEYSLGSDTCLNALLEYVDTLRQSAESSRRRVFVIETQGGESGYIATMAGLACGALAVYTPEEGISLEMLAKDIKHLKETFAKDHGQDKAGKIILVNEKASKHYNAYTINNIIEEEAKGRFDTRVGIPGHFQQGKVPSPLDRCRAVRFAVRSMQHLESYAGKSRHDIANDPESAAVIGIRSAKVSVTSAEYLENHETDWVHRRPKHAHWLHMKQLGDVLAGRPRDSELPDSDASFTVA